MHKKLTALVAILLLVAFIATFLTGCGKKGSNKPTTTADPNDVTIISTADPNTTDTPDNPEATYKSTTDWSDEEVVEHAQKMLANYLAGPRDHHDFETDDYGNKYTADEYGFKIYVNQNEITVAAPRYTECGQYWHAVIGATYPHDFELVNLIHAFEEGRYWVRTQDSGWVVSSYDYTHTATISNDGELFIDGLPICPVRSFIEDYVDLDTLCRSYRLGEWDGGLLYDRNGTTAGIDYLGRLEISGENVEYISCFPAIGLVDGMKSALTVSQNHRTVALFEDGTIAVYERDGRVISSYDTGICDLTEDSFVLAPRGSNQKEYDDTVVWVHASSVSSGKRFVLSVDTVAGTIRNEYEGCFIVLLHNYESTYGIVHQEGSTLWVMDGEWNDIPIVYGITTIESSSNYEVVCRLDNGVTYTVDLDSMLDYR